MRIVKPGHVYELENVDGSGVQTIGFVVRRDEKAELLPPVSRETGVLSQELVRVLIDRTLYLNAEDPCTEDIEIIHHLRDCLRLFESRAARKTIEKLAMPETADACPICHHLLCSHRPPERLRHDVRR